MPTQSITLTDQQAEFVRHNVETGEYQDVDEVVRAALRLLARQVQQDKIKLEIFEKAGRRRVCLF